MAIRQSSTVIMGTEWLHLILKKFALGTPNMPSLDEAKVRLFKGSITPVPGTTLAELDAAECDFDNYVEATVSQWNDVSAGLNLWALFSSSYFYFLAGPTPVTNTVAGYYVVDATNNLICSERFETGVVMAADGDFLDLNIFVPFAPIVPIG